MHPAGPAHFARLPGPPRTLGNYRRRKVAKASIPSTPSEASGKGSGSDGAAIPFTTAEIEVAE
jgi:hypothetical protein